MNNCCLIDRTTNTCHTTSQPLSNLNRGIVHNGGPASNNASIHTIIDQLKYSDSGAVHFISGINGNHWILVSLIKELRNNQCSIGYMDSNNKPLENQPDALHCIKFIRDNYCKHLLS